ncbi:MAG: efflux RND transporter permease subunit [candidate division WOR-3 bacterium]
MRLSDTAIRRPVTTIMVTLALLVFGLVGVTRMPVDVFPKVTLPMIVIATFYPGAGPLEVESEITDPIEKRVGTISGIKDITSRSLENISVIQIQFEWGTDLDAASSDVRDRLDMAVAQLPDAASRPFVLKFDASMMPVLQIGVYGDVDPMTLRDIAEDIADGIQRAPGVATASAAGGTRRQVLVSVDLRRLAAAGISIDNLNLTLKAQNLNYPAGSITAQGRRYLIRLLGEYPDIEAVRNTVVGSRGNSPILLKEIADVSWQPEERQAIARYNGQSCVFVVVQRRPDANTVRVAAAARRELERLRSTLPAGCNATVFFDSSQQVTRSVSSVAANILFGGILAVIVLFLFLRRLRATMFVAFAIPVSVFFALFFMFLLGFSVNILSMAGLAMAVGMVVDNGIVVFESIFRHRERGAEPIAAASTGANEVAMAITASTLTTVVVFLPMLLVRGLLQIFFRELVWAVVGSLAASLAVALTLIPSLASRYLRMPRPETVSSGLRGWSERVYRRLEALYDRLIGWAVGHKRVVVAVAVLLLLVSLGLIPFIGREFIPMQESWFHQVIAEMPVGTDLAVTDSAVSRLEDYIRNNWSDDVKGIATQIGAGSNVFATIMGNASPNAGQLNIILKPKRQRRHSIAELDQGIRQAATQIPGLKVRASELSFVSMAGVGGAALQLDIIGHDLAVAETLTRQVIAAIETIPGLVDLRSSREPGKPEIQLIVDRQQAALYGLTPYQIGSALRTQIEGNAASQFRLEGREYDIFVRLDERQRNSLAEVLGTTITGPMGPVPLRSLVTVRTGTSPLIIEHRNTERIVRITGNAVGTTSGQLAAAVSRAIRPIVVPAGFTIRLSGSYEEMLNAFRDLALVTLIAAILVFMVMASQFESLRDPFVIIFSVPFAIVGVLWTLFITRTSLSVISGLGVLVLVGVVVNNGIVYVDYCNQLRRNRGLSLIDAVKEAGRVRLRPILMTSLTTIFGLLPLALQIGEGSELWAPLGRAMAGGMIFSTLLPLVLIPVLYVIFETRAERRRQRWAAAAANG